MTEAAPPAPAPAPAQPDPAKKGIRWVLLLIIVSLAWYLLADRYTPYTQQARVGAFVIPVANIRPGIDHGRRTGSVRRSAARSHCGSCQPGTD